ncbi:MAG: C39 family peptidase [Romboutsia timonensis]|jgi:hypothetical protein|uniref:C39 family peptidase n=1 Tax=Romboutsia timonensis TaxID=1776391 RepID=UPI003995041C
MFKLNAKVKKYLMCSLMLSTILSPALSFANEAENNVMNGDSSIYSRSSQESQMITIEDQIEQVKNNDNLSQKDKEEFLSKLEETKIMPYATSVVGVTKSVPYYKQETSYYCGPATTKQTLQYVKGSSPTQKTIANSLGTTTNGTDGTKIVSYLNANQSKIKYIIAKPSSQDNFTTLVNAALRSYNSPPILRVKYLSGDGWPYTTNGHFLNISGQRMNGTKIEHRLTDPYIQWKQPNVTSGTFYRDSAITYKGIKNHFAQHFYY